MSKPTGIMAAVAKRYSQMPCRASGCKNNRRGIALYCIAHDCRQTRYGHPHGRPISQKEYQAELEEVALFLKEQADHPAVKSALTFFSQWLEQAAAGKAESGQYIFGRLNGRLIAPSEILSEVSAIWLYSQRNPYQLPDDERLTYCFARNAARLATFEVRHYGATNRSKSIKHPPPKELRETGQKIRLSLARFLVNLQFGLTAKTARAEQFRADLGTPFA